METTWTTSSHQKWLQPTGNSSSMMKPSEERSVVDKESCLQTAVISPTSTLPSSCQTESDLNLEIVPEANHKLTFAAVSTQQPSVPTLHLTAITDTSVASAKNQVIQSWIASLERERLHRSLYPKYLHYNIWTEDSFSLSTADWITT